MSRFVLPYFGPVTDLQLAGLYGGSIVAIYIASLIYFRLIKRSGSETTATMYDGTKLQIISGDVGAVGVYKEMYQDHVYMQNGITLDGVKNPIVIDAGVNIGMFSRYIAEKYPTARVFGAEPIDVLADIARKNNSKYTDRVKILQAGLGKNPGSFPIHYKPTLSSASTMHPEDITACANKGRVDWVCCFILDGMRVGAVPLIFKPLEPLLRIPYIRGLVLLALAPLYPWIVAWAAGSMVKERVIDCKIVTMEQLLSTLGAPATGPIDLLKIDVEGAEMLVLEGVSDALWDRIQQVVVEVHDLNGRLEQVRRLFAAKGFDKIVTDKETWEVHRLLNISSIFARKTAAKTK